ALEDEALVFRVGVEARLRCDRLGIRVGMPAGNPAGDLLEQVGIRLARLVGIDLPARVVNARLEPVARVVQRILDVSTGLRVELADGGQRGAFAPEVGERLAGRPDRHGGEKPPYPSARGYHDHLGVQGVEGSRASL